MVLSGLVAAIGVGLACWFIFQQGSTRPAPASSGATFATWIGAVDAARLERHLVQAGYSIRVTGTLDPITKSALGDYLRVSAAHPISLSLGNALRGTVLTGRRDPSAWNSRFGLNRRTRFVERPLTGPGGQLDANGNVRQ